MANSIFCGLIIIEEFQEERRGEERRGEERRGEERRGGRGERRGEERGGEGRGEERRGRRGEERGGERRGGGEERRGEERRGGEGRGGEGRGEERRGEGRGEERRGEERRGEERRERRGEEREERRPKTNHEISAQMDPGGSGCRIGGALECIQASTQQYANHQWTTAPECHPGLSIWLSTKNILLFTVSRNPSRFIGPFTNKDIVSPATVTLTLPEDVATSNLCPPAKSPRLIDSDPVYPVHCLIGVRPTIPGGYGRV
ncbi:hypothetical protein D4764_13G0002760 [Takifugu flavidus]|uniref:Uncharacterized protein n=1 Tax=Takifugu flavidus TaxID=433684 RepID=A0A5C6P716_9TELE|nr:hypothetical protein D4764_13G0002760 [Takifugu flavidus]